MTQYKIDDIMNKADEEEQKLTWQIEEWEYSMYLDYLDEVDKMKRYWVDDRMKYEDIKINLEILKAGGLHAKIHSFVCLWYPFKGSVKDHIKFLERMIK